MLAFQVPASVKAGSLDPRQLPFKRLFPDPVDNRTALINVPRGMVIGGPGPLLYVADAGPPGAILVVNPTPPYAVRGALALLAGLPFRAAAPVALCRAPMPQSVVHTHSGGARAQGRCPWSSMTRSC